MPENTPSDGSKAQSNAPSRRRARQACGPCKLRKRRCDGRMPCDSCRQYDYECHYPLQHRRRSAKVAAATNAVESSPVSQSKHSIDDGASTPSDQAVSQAIEANSGIGFPRLVGVGIDPKNAPNLDGLGWGLGLRYHHNASKDSITWIISKAEWTTLLATYTQKIHSIYSFLDMKVVHLRSLTRWDDANASNSYDHVLCGIAALASFFTPNANSEKEQLLIDCAKGILEHSSMVSIPTYHDAQAWVLRLLYVRCNDSPHATWMLSGTTMQIMEAARLHKEDNSITGHPNGASNDIIDIECLRKTYWLARMQNMWTSSEYGRTHIDHIGVTRPFPKKSQTDQMSGFLEVLQYTTLLRPDRKIEAAELERTLREIDQHVFATDALLLSKSNFCFTTYRRLRPIVGRMKQDTQDIIINTGCQGVQAALRLAQNWCPWWHVLNIPFQFCCVLLAMDTPQSLSHVQQTLDTLRAITEIFNSRITKTALATIEQLVQMAYNRKQHDLNALSSGIAKNDNSAPDIIEGVPPLAAAGDALLTNDFLWNAQTFQENNWDHFWDAAFPANAQMQLGILEDMNTNNIAARMSKAGPQGQ